MSSSGVLLFTVLLMGYLYWSLAQPTNPLQIRCKLAVPIPDPRMCAYGAHFSYCGKLACHQGPGQICGSEREAAVKFGQCADGLDCCNNKCQGCFGEECYGESCNPLDMRLIGHHTYNSPSNQLESLYPRAEPFFNYFNQ